MEALGDFCLHKDRCTLITLVGVLFVNRGVVLLRVVAALHNAGNKLSQLTEGVPGVVNMRLRLESVSIAREGVARNHIPSHPSST